MSLFANLLSQFISDSPYSIKKLSDECNVDRTVIQKYISGERLPNSYKNIEKIINKLTLTKKQKKNLRKTYDIEKIGIDKYNHFIKLKQIIENINHININHIEINYNLNTKHTIAKNIDELIINIHFIINDAINSKDNTLKLYIPTNNTLYSTIINSFYLSHNFHIKQILHLENDQENYKNMLNLIQFDNCFFTLLSQNVITKYNYNNFISTLSHYISYSYMICSEQYTLLIDSQLSSGILLTNEISQFLNHQFDIIFKNSQIYNSQHFSSFGYLQYHHDFHYVQNHNHYIIANEPSIISVIDDNLFDYHFIGNKCDYNKIKKYFSDYKNYILNLTITNTLNIYFTKSGLQAFIDTGFTCEFPKEYMTPLSKKERIFILKRFMNIINSNKNYQLHLINENYFTFPQQCIISYQENSDIMIMINSNNQNSTIFIKELTIKKEFYHFESFIKLEELEYDVIYTKHYLQQFIKNNS